MNLPVIPLRVRRPVTLLENGHIAFATILQHIERAREKIEIRAFVWRDDESGNRLARALLSAADRGVRVAIQKDRVAATYEYLGGNKQSFFHKRPHPTQWAQAHFLRFAYGVPGHFRQQPSELARRLLSHPLISVAHHRRIFDHAKLFVFDDEIMVLGSMGIGDNHQKEWVDAMIEISGREHVARMRDRQAQREPFDPSRRVDFLVHTQGAEQSGRCSMLSQRLELIESASESLTIEMAYLGDGRFTSAILRAIARGVNVTIVTAAHADLLGDLNLATVNRIVRKSGAPAHLDVVLLPTMVHTKAVVVDRRYCDFGSANFTPLSHGVYDEMNVLVDDPAFATHVERVIQERVKHGSRVGDRVRFSRFNWLLEWAIVAYQSRRVV